jgi:ribosomal protein S18 acetylase RimI-like enzyme
VQPNYRGQGLGRALAEAIINEARDIGYTHMRLDTIPSMKAALSLYTSLGFREIEAYRFNPIEGAKYLELELR